MRKRVTPLRGEVWLLDLGMVEEVWPALIVSIQYTDSDRALITARDFILSGT